MYGGFWTTPPQSAASTVAPASVRRISRVRYSSPAAAALSVLSIPPMIVTSAKGSASERYGSVASSASSHASVGQGIASASVTATGGPASPPRPSHARSQKRAVPARTAANAPGTPSGIRTRPKSPSSSTRSATRPTSGSRRILSVGRTPIRRLERMTSCVMLSRARPRNPLRSPGLLQPRRGSARSRVGRPLRAEPGAREPLRPLGERRAPREAPAAVRDLAVVELHDRAHQPPEPEPRAIGLPLPLVARLELHLEPRIDTLRVRGEEIPEPAPDLVVAAAGKHGSILHRLDAWPSVGQHSLKPHDRHFLHPSS